MITILEALVTIMAGATFLFLYALLVAGMFQMFWD